MEHLHPCETDTSWYFIYFRQLQPPVITSYAVVGLNNQKIRFCHKPLPENRFLFSLIMLCFTKWFFAISFPSSYKIENSRIKGKYLLEICKFVVWPNHTCSTFLKHYFHSSTYFCLPISTHYLFTCSFVDIVYFHLHIQPVLDLGRYVNNVLTPLPKWLNWKFWRWRKSTFLNHHSKHNTFFLNYHFSTHNCIKT